MASSKLTTSTSKSMAFRGTHNFKIRDFSFLKGMGVGKCIDSDVFSVGRYLWRIKFYPDGFKKDDKGDFYISVLVELVSKCEEEDLTACFEFYLLDQNRKRWYRRKGIWFSFSFSKAEMNRRYMSEPFTITNAGSKTRGLWDFYKRSDLDESKFLIDDCLTIQCSVSVAKTSMDVHVPETRVEPLPLSGLKQSYEQLLKSREGSDVSFEVEGEILCAHKLILSARSSFFKAQFFGPLKDDNTQCIKMEEIKAPIFKALLRFVYCDDIPDLDSDCVGMIMTQHLLVAADRYGIETLKSLCESRLYENIAIDSAASTLALAEQHGCFQLKSSCLEFINLPENLQAVMQTDGFKNLSESCPAAICELLKSVARERDFSCDANGKRAKLSK